MYIWEATCESRLREERGYRKVTVQALSPLNSFFFLQPTSREQARPNNQTRHNRSWRLRVARCRDQTLLDIWWVCVCFLWIIYTGLILRSIATEVTSTHIPHRHFLKCTTDSQWTLPRWVTKSASSVWKWPSHLYATTMRLPFSLLRASTHQGLPALDSFGDTLTQKHNFILIKKKQKTSKHTSPEYWECFTTSQVLRRATKTPSFLGCKRDNTFTASYN